MTNTENLWPDIIMEEEIRSPKIILKEQANFLGEITKNILAGEVDTSSFNNTIFNSFSIVAPLLNNYKYKLFEIRHTMVLYPCSIEFEGITIKILNEKDLVDVLKSIFNNDTTKKVIQSLIAQSKEV
ncbi:hypothetical protein SAMN04515674_102406 [Pseudarcicella hirudinis]|uniref:Uncharacterized protein n=1 Tax=Pseudarcicella hirudinis TaxID=1079859 RepID=A0A1I5PE48_9BACT|nr:hypothetical protein [Pseudarcicella hirudinis]SFP31766.1 hypothetical protein SAMN04515674_102406 [Pseudarcicella hirudinis]